jgi:hypothetical protein
MTTGRRRHAPASSSGNRVRDVLIEHARKFLLFANQREPQLRVDRKSETGRMYFLSHGLSFTFSLPRVLGLWQPSSPNGDEDMAGRLADSIAAALGAGMKRLSVVPCSTMMVLTCSSSMSAPSLCSALAMADSSTFLMILRAPFSG